MMACIVTTPDLGIKISPDRMPLGGQFAVQGKSMAGRTDTDNRLATLDKVTDDLQICFRDCSPPDADQGQVGLPQDVDSGNDVPVCGAGMDVADPEVLRTMG